jgi:hypothetical protein
MEHTESRFPEPRKGNYRFENSYAGLIGTDVIDIHAILLSQLVDPLNTHLSVCWENVHTRLVSDVLHSSIR